MVADANALAASGYPNDATHNAYFDDEIDESLPADHPRRILVRSAQKAVAMDLLPADFAPRAIYESDEITPLRRRRAREGRALPLGRPARRLQHDRLRGGRRARLALRPERVLGHADDPALRERRATSSTSRSSASPDDEHYDDVRDGAPGHDRARVTAEAARASPGRWRSSAAASRSTASRRSSGATPRMNSVLTYVGRAGAQAERDGAADVLRPHGVVGLLLGCERLAAEQQLGDLDRVQRRALAEVVARRGRGRARSRSVGSWRIRPTSTSSPPGRLAGRGEVDDAHARRGAEQRPRLVGRERSTRSRATPPRRGRPSPARGRRSALIGSSGSSMIFRVSSRSFDSSSNSTPSKSQSIRRSCSSRLLAREPLHRSTRRRPTPTGRSRRAPAAGPPPRAAASARTSAGSCSSSGWRRSRRARARARRSPRGRRAARRRRAGTRTTCRRRPRRRAPRGGRARASRTCRSRTGRGRGRRRRAPPASPPRRRAPRRRTRPASRPTAPTRTRARRRSRARRAARA